MHINDQELSYLPIVLNVEEYVCDPHNFVSRAMKLDCRQSRRYEIMVRKAQSFEIFQRAYVFFKVGSDHGFWNLSVCVWRPRVAEIANVQLGYRFVESGDKIAREISPSSP